MTKHDPFYEGGVFLEGIVFRFTKRDDNIRLVKKVTYIVLSINIKVQMNQQNTGCESCHRSHIICALIYLFT